MEFKIMLKIERKKKNCINWSIKCVKNREKINTHVKVMCEHTKFLFAKCWRYGVCICSGRTNAKQSKANVKTKYKRRRWKQQYHWRHKRCTKIIVFGNTILTTVVGRGIHRVEQKNLIASMCVLPRLSKCIVYLAFEMLRALCHTQTYTDTHHPNTNRQLTVLLLARSHHSCSVWLACMGWLCDCVCVCVCLFGVCAFLFSFASSCVIVVVYPISLYSTACCSPVSRDSRQPTTAPAPAPTVGSFVVYPLPMFSL